MTIRSTSSLSAEREMADIESACLRRDKRALYAAFARGHERLRPGEPVDLWRVKAGAHCYASQIFGWEVEDA